MMEITDVHGEYWVVRRRWQPWTLRFFGLELAREAWKPELLELADLAWRAALSVLFVLLGVIEAVAAAVALPIVFLLRLVGATSTTVEVHEHGQHRQRRQQSRTVWTVPVPGWRRARSVRDGLAAFVREHGNDDQLHRRLADDPQAREFERAITAS